MNQGPRGMIHELMDHGTHYPRRTKSQRRRGVILRTGYMQVRSGRGEATSSLGKPIQPKTCLGTRPLPRKHPGPANSDKANLRYVRSSSSGSTGAKRYVWLCTVYTVLYMYVLCTPFIIADLHTYLASSSQSVLRQRYKRDT